MKVKKLPAVVVTHQAPTHLAGGVKGIFYYG